MSKDVYYLNVLVKTPLGNRLENRAYIPTRSGSLLEEYTNIRFRDQKTGRVISGGDSRKNFIQNPFHSESSVVLDTKDILFIYLSFLFPSIIILIACLCYIYTSQVLDDTYLIMFYVFGILLSIFDLLTLSLHRCMETTTMSIKIVFFILGTITFTCSVLIIYFSKIQLDAEQDTTTTLIICVVFIVIFAILTLYYIFIFKSKERSEPEEDPRAKALREKYGTINANRISESG